MIRKTDINTIKKAPPGLPINRDKFPDALGLAAGIDHDRLAGGGVGDDRAVALEAAGRERLAQHHDVVARALGERRSRRASV